MIGWFQGAMEFGPRALSDIAAFCDPRRADMKDILNRRIKHREPFRPFAPAILADQTAEWFVSRPVASDAPLLMKFGSKNARWFRPSCMPMVRGDFRPSSVNTVQHFTP